MKKATLINSEVSYVVSKMGHFDALTICDAGLPIPKNVQRIDLAVSEGIPPILDTLKAVLSEMEVESVELAEEFPTVSPALHQKIISVVERLAFERDKEISINYVSHENFKTNTEQSVAIIRTGEFTPYANITLKSGVVF